MLRAARKNDELREAFRRLILTEDLLETPEQLRTLTLATRNLAATGEALLEHAATTNQRLGSIDERIAELVKGMADYKTDTENQLVSIGKDVTEMKASVSRLDDAIREQEQAQSSFRGDHAQTAANNDDLDIAALFAGPHGLNENRTKTRHVRRSVLEQWVDDHEDLLLSLDLRQEGALRKFQRPDIVAAVSDSPSNEVRPAYYIAVEASYSGEKKDIDNATDNAKILRAVTGLVAYPVVAAVRLHHRMDDESRSRFIRRCE